MQSSDRSTSAQGEVPKSANAFSKKLSRSLALLLAEDFAWFAIQVLVNCPTSPDLEVTPGRISSTIRVWNSFSKFVLALIRSLDQYLI